MACGVLECLFCSLPSLLLLLLSLGPRWPRLRRCTNWLVSAAGWRLWLIICWTLGLPSAPEETGSVAPAGSAGSLGSGGSDLPASGSDGLRLLCKPTALARYLQRHCSSLFEPRLAPWPRGDPHLQTWSSMLLEKHEGGLEFTRDHLLLRDGGVVALDWALGTRLLEAPGIRRGSSGRSLGCFTSSPPVLLLVPQRWAGSSPHMRALCHHAVQQGFYAVLFHSRGAAGCPLTTARLTEFGDPADLEQAIAYVHSRFPSSALVAVSEGCGSGPLLSYLGESGSSSHLTAAAAISPVLLGQRWMEADLPAVYRCMVTLQQKLLLSRYKSSLQEIMDVDAALHSSSLRDLEEALFCCSTRKNLAPPSRCRTSTQGSNRFSPPALAWALGERAKPAMDWDDYWERNEPLRDADEVAVPVLCIRSRDDPLLPSAGLLPLPLFQSNPYFLLALTDRGGHCGFTLDGQTDWTKEDSDNWSHVVVLEFFKAVADFLRVEPREEAPSGGVAQQRGWAGKAASLHRRRTTVTRRRRRPEYSRAEMEEEEEAVEEEEFIWKRSYTR